MKVLAFLGLAAALFTNTAHACSMTALSGTTYLMKRVSQYVAETSSLETSVDQIQLHGFSARVRLTSGDGQCQIQTYQITFDDRCVASVTQLQTQPEACDNTLTQ